jgi:hypothetical protein
MSSLKRRYLKGTVSWHASVTIFSGENAAENSAIFLSRLRLSLFDEVPIHVEGHRWLESGQ